MVNRPSLIDAALGDLNGAVGKPLKPENSSKSDARQYSMVKLEAHGMRPMSGCDIAVQHALSILPCLRLIPPIVQQDPHHPLADQLVGRINRTGGKAAEPLGKRQHGPIV